MVPGQFVVGVGQNQLEADCDEDGAPEHSGASESEDVDETAPEDVPFAVES